MLYIPIHWNSSWLNLAIQSLDHECESCTAMWSAKGKINNVFPHTENNVISSRSRPVCSGHVGIHVDDSHPLPSLNSRHAGHARTHYSTCRNHLFAGWTSILNLLRCYILRMLYPARARLNPIKKPLMHPW
jgi:hypothetical protein